MLHSGLLRFYIAGKFPMFIVWVNERNVKKKGARDSFYFGIEQGGKRPLFFYCCYRSLLQALPLRGRGVQRKKSPQSTPLCLRARGREVQRDAPSISPLQAISCNRLRLLRVLRGTYCGALFFWYCYRSLLQALPLRGRGVQRKEYLQSTPLCLRARGREGQHEAPFTSPLQAISCNRLRPLHALRGNRALPGHPLCQREYSPLRENAFAHEVSRL